MATARQSGTAGGAAMTVESWPLVVLLLVVRVVSESRGKLLPVVVAVGSIAR